MTVQELIKMLKAVKDKNKRITLFVHGEHYEIGDSVEDTYLMNYFTCETKKTLSLVPFKKL